MENNYIDNSVEIFLFDKDRTNSFSVPEGYFNSISDRLLNKIECKEEIREFENLSNINRELKFTVPQNYFSTFQNILEHKLDLSLEPEYFKTDTDNTKEKIHSYKNNLTDILNQLIAFVCRPKNAFALSFVLIMGLASVWFFNKNDSGVVLPIKGDCQTLACLEKNELLNDQNIFNLDDENLYEMVDEEMLDKKLLGASKKQDSLKTNFK